jgi:2-amino-4-hydroxy-6-hydroxymethyldihydropteridine diphosphokinase
VPHRAYIGIGSNLGDRRANAVEAVARVKALAGTKVVRSSSLYESEPLGDAKTWFVNGVIELETELPADRLLKGLLAIEEAMGRKRAKGKRWGSRIIDLDVLLFDQAVIAKRSLQVPHPEMHKRRFVLLPFAELAPHVVHPTLGRSVSALLAKLQDSRRVHLLRPEVGRPEPAPRPEPRLGSGGRVGLRRSAAGASGVSRPPKPARRP